MGGGGYVFDAFLLTTLLTRHRLLHAAGSAMADIVSFRQCQLFIVTDAALAVDEGYVG